MNINIHTIQSSSKGNSFIIEFPNTAYALDIGCEPIMFENYIVRKKFTIR